MDHRNAGREIGVHTILAFEYADATARLAAGGFVLEDIGKVAKQLDDGSKWILDSITPSIAWSPLGAAVSLVNLSSVLFVDPNTTVVSGAQTGNDQAPFSTLGQALAASADNGTIMVCPPGFTDGIPIDVTKSVTIQGFGRSLLNTPDIFRYFRVPIPPLNVDIDGGGAICLVDVECQKNVEGLISVAEVTCATGSVVQLCNALAQIVFSGDRGTVVVLDPNPWGMDWLSITNGDLFSGPLSLHVDGTSTVTANIPMNSKKFTGLADGVDPQDSATVAQLSSLVTVMHDVDLTITATTTVDTRPALPVGPGRWKLIEIVLRMKVAVTSGGASAIVRVGSTSGGQEIVIDQTILPAASVGDIVGGFSLSTLGTDMSQATGFEAIYPASQSIYVDVTAAGAPEMGTLTAYLLWMALP